MRDTLRKLTGVPSRRSVTKGIGGSLAAATLGGVAAGEERSTSGNAAGSGGDDGRGRADEPAMIAHRGYAGVYPQNTLAAVRAASRGRDRADMVEIDILPCADGTPVVFHDSTLDRLTDASGPVAETSCETVLDAEVLDSGETIPTLRAVMEAIPPSVGVNVEYKYADRSFVERSLPIATAHRNPILVSSFSERALANVRDVDPSVRTAYLFGGGGSPLATAEWLGCEAIHPSQDAVDADLVARAHERGFAVNPYTVTTWREAQRLRSLGVDGIISDYPNVLAFDG